MTDKITKTEDEWRSQLSAEEYSVCRQNGTERAFSGRYWDSKIKGMYHCIGCGEALFDSETKYDSGSGWPSFYQPVTNQCVEETRDTSHGMVRVEVHCAKCESHLGHVFEDGPQPTGLRYCINSLSLNLKEKE
ncbi:peptide-methionine (R)-S-oxide reductase MsrB [Terasakiella sp. SH-1]|uniref:peptide-methionine (R)-S-oxide reductase MsrB n=1 Tax=Terasakiella sp. SH-1 TaxID=2560057 RepID=UPI0010735732|nr:peptide-methionine (R)-S-oxide reductase MsrB [Terasakiella sp. SH-1]